MFRLVLFLSLFPVIIALLARWWFVIRVLKTTGMRTCQCDLNRWTPTPGDDALVHRAEDTAAEFGRQLRNKALAEWEQHEPKGAKSREGIRRFGMASPPLSGVIAVFAVIVGKIPVIGALAILVATTAIAAIMGLLSLPAELAAITRSAGRLREQRQFPKDDDERAVIRCAMAHAWEASLPSILKWM